MAVVKHIAPASAFKLGLTVHAILGLIVGIVCSITVLAAIAPNLRPRMPFMHGFGALLPILLCPIVYGVIGGVATVISAAIYNLASRWVGGLEVDIG